MYFWTWDTEEVLDMILWMRQFNAAGKRIQSLGFDMQTAAVAGENARRFVAEVDPDFAKEVAEAYDGLPGDPPGRSAEDQVERGQGRWGGSRVEGTCRVHTQGHGGGPGTIPRRSAPPPRSIGRSRMPASSPRRPS